jgi:glycosyltransferase involved in cell wall biosynthesis
MAGCASINLLASPVDAVWLSRFARTPEKTHIIFNGVGPVSEPVAKVPRRLIFSGRMDFPPNHEAALWFIDSVLPLLIKNDPSIKLVVAGADPLPELRSRESANVTVIGFVEDMATEIAASQLYVAPMLSGSGFKNKVAEAIANGTFVAGTSLAFEFLDKELRELVLVGNTPVELADAISKFLADPRSFEGRLNRLRELAVERFQWAGQADRLAQLIGGYLI